MDVLRKALNCLIFTQICTVANADFIRVEDMGLRSKVKLSTKMATARAFLSQYGKSIGIKDIDSLKAKSTDQKNMVVFSQKHKGLDVYASSVKFIFNKNDDLLAINSDFSKIEKLNTNPSLNQNKAVQLATQFAAGGDVSLLKAGVKTSMPKLLIYPQGLLQGKPVFNHLAYEVEVALGKDKKDFVYIDAHDGSLLNIISQIHHSSIEVSETSLSNVSWVSGDVFPTQNVDWNNEISGSLESYNLFSSMAGRDSYDGKGAVMRVVNNDPSIQCPNANWNGVSTNYCTDVTADDTVAHEWGHAYTEYINGLIYQWEPGALNESYSDIWGEVVDFINNRGEDTHDVLRTADECSVYGRNPGSDDTYRWLSGEDDPAFNGAIRDLWNPNCYGHPGKVTDSKYHCADTDSGGVHRNSGVNNHAFALLVDGGDYNGIYVKGLGLTKAAHIFYHAQSMLNPASGFEDQAQALLTSCDFLEGSDLSAISTTDPKYGTFSDEIVSQSDCREVGLVIEATELKKSPEQCNFKPLLKPDAPELCNGGSVNSLEMKNWDSGLESWSVGKREIANSSTFDAKDWYVVSGLPGGKEGSAIFAEDNPKNGNCAEDTEAGIIYLESPEWSAPSGGSVKIAFDHYVATEAGWDGGTLSISVEGGSWRDVSASAFQFNGYNSRLNSVSAGSDNPNAGKSAFTGTDGGDVSGSWGQSQLDLSSYVSAGENFKIRFEMAFDGCGGVVGWYLGDVNLYQCQ